jgi:hypothetical protein
VPLSDGLGGVLVVATTLLCCENARLSIRSSVFKLCFTDPSEANEAHATNFGCVTKIHPNRTAVPGCCFVERNVMRGRIT